MKVSSYQKDLLRFAYCDFWKQICETLHITDSKIIACFSPDHRETDRCGNPMGMKRLDRFVGWACCQQAIFEKHYERQRLISEYITNVIPFVKMDIAREEETQKFFKDYAEQKAKAKPDSEDDQMTFNF